MSRHVKRLMDVAIASIALVLLSPALALTALVILLEMGRPVLFRQVRPGYHGRPFEIVKFRSLGPEADAGGRSVPRELRETKLGALLRRTSVDELPELWNVVRGEMSLVGPRPLLMDYLPRYDAEQARRHDVKPGMTGLAQVKGRQHMAWDRRFELDLWYVDHWSLGLDLRILAATAREVVRGQAVGPPPEGEREFEGSAAP
jgi:sugar transferase EpsL